MGMWPPHLGYRALLWVKVTPTKKPSEMARRPAHVLLTRSGLTYLRVPDRCWTSSLPRQELLSHGAVSSGGAP